MLGVGPSWPGDIEPPREGDWNSCACTVDAAEETEDRRAVGVGPGDSGPNPN